MTVKLPLSLPAYHRLTKLLSYSMTVGSIDFTLYISKYFHA
jgi:hypothetical protein